MLYEGEAKCSKVGSVMKWWSKRISMTITKTSGRDVTFKTARMSESALESLDEVIVRKLEVDEVGSDCYDKAALDDIGYNADLYSCIFSIHQLVVQD